jgi:hypothetical protein
VLVPEGLDVKVVPVALVSVVLVAAVVVSVPLVVAAPEVVVAASVVVASEAVGTGLGFSTEKVGVKL